MKRDPLHALLRIRRSVLDEAQKAVADAYQQDLQAVERVEAAHAALQKEAEAAGNLAAGDDAVETFARWLPIGRRDVQLANEARLDSATALDRARALLTLARSGVRSVETLIEQRRLDQDLNRRRDEQQILDEAGLHRRG